MKNYYNENLNETIYIETLDNGLNLVILHKIKNVTSSAYLAFPYGSLNIMQQDQQGKQFQFNPGSAHFLEHKLFENHKGLDVMERFSMLSCNVNAFTSANETAYYFNTSSLDIKEPLNLLLDFVQELNITTESVDKEKQIIIQELRSYHQMPESRLMFETLQALYSQNPIKFDIGGSEESVNAITKEELDLCFKLNYHPKNALLVIVSSLDPELLCSIVKENQAIKSFDPHLKLEDVEIIEPELVTSDLKIVPMDIQSSKLTYSFKLKPQNLSEFERSNLEWKLKIYLELLFTSINPDYENWVKNGIIHDYFGYDVEFNKNYWYVMFYGETEDKDTFVKLIESTLKTDINPLLPYLKQLKRRYLSYAYRLLDDQDDYAIHYIRSYFSSLRLEDTIEIINNLNSSDILEVGSILETQHKSVIIIERSQTGQNDTND